MNQLLLTSVLTGALALAAFNTAQAQPMPAEQDMANLFCYFHEPDGLDGVHLAWSDDGLNWNELNDGKSVLKQNLRPDGIMRDPCIARGPDGTFHLIWTTGWNGNTIGYASSKDLIHWSEQKAIAVMGDTPGVKNCWAPEMIYDTKREQWLIFWSSSVEGRFVESQAKGDRWNNRVYSCTTKDFQTFSPPQLFFDPGYVVIDPTILPFEGRFVMVFKDETLEPVARKNLCVAWSDDVNGPYGEITPPFTPDYWVEGPSVLPLNGEFFIYFDAYHKVERHYGAMKTRDFVSFEDLSKAAHFPAHAAHGSIFTAPRAVLENLQKLTTDQ